MLNRTHLRARLASAAAGALVLTGLAWPAHAAAGGTIVGSVEGSDHIVATGVDVWIYTPDGEFVEDTVSDAFGNYTFDELEPGSYKIRFENQDEATLEWYANKPDMQTATLIPVAAGATVRVDAYMPISGENIATPVVTGTATVGSTLTATSGTWFPAPSFGFTYQWLRGGEPVTGATATTYALTAADANQRISVTVTANNYGSLASATSAQTVAVTGGAGATVANVTLPTVSGTVKVGSTVTAGPGTWNPGNVSVTYQWLRGGSTIPSATGTTYAVTPADVNLPLSVRATATATTGTYLPGQATSAATTVAPGAFTTSSSPTISGTPAIGSTLTATTGTWSPTPTSWVYTWIDSVTQTVLATGPASTYAVTAGDAGRTIAVRVQGVAAGYAGAPTTSAATTAVPSAGIGNLSAPVRSGTARVGSTLSTTTGTWSTSATYTYRWLRDGASISGATGRTYKLTASDVGRRISARVTATAGGEQGTATTTASSAVAKATSKVTASGSSASKGKAKLKVKVTSAGSRRAKVTVTVTSGGKKVTKTATVSSSGTATVSFTKLTKGKRTFTISYAGSSSAASAKTTKKLTVK